MGFYRTVALSQHTTASVPQYAFKIHASLLQVRDRILIKKLCSLYGAMLVTFKHWKICHTHNKLFPLPCFNSSTFSHRKEEEPLHLFCEMNEGYAKILSGTNPIFQSHSLCIFLLTLSYKPPEAPSVHNEIMFQHLSKWKSHRPSHCSSHFYSNINKPVGPICCITNILTLDLVAQDVFGLLGFCTLPLSEIVNKTGHVSEAEALWRHKLCWVCQLVTC